MDIVGQDPLKGQSKKKTFKKFVENPNTFL